MNLPADLKQRAKALLPAGTRVRGLPLGIGRGLRMGVDLRRGHIGLCLGLYEVELNRHLRRLCVPGARCFDVGGSIGYDALVLAKLSRSDILTVESSPELCDRITENAQANPALAGSISVLSAYVDESSDVAGHVTIDELADRYFVPDFIKVDIEGGEESALIGAENVLRERRPGLVIEVHSAELEDACLGLLRGHGYEPVVVNQRRILPDHRPTAHNRWLVADGAVDGVRRPCS